MDRSDSRKKRAGRAFAVLAGLSLFGSAWTPPENQSDVLDQGGAINWTTLSIRADVSLAWQPLAVDAAEKRVPVAALARRRALAELQKTLLSLPIDGDVQVRDLMAESSLSYDVQNFVPEFAKIVLPMYSAGDTAFMGMGIGLCGPSGFLSMLSNHFPLYQLPPWPRGQTRAAFHHSGVIVDARHLPFQPALGTRIFNAGGDMVYGITYTDRAIYVEDGHILFLREHDDPRAGQRAGARPFWVVAKDVRGPANTDLVLFDADSDSMLASPITRSHLKRCRVVVLCNSIKK